MRILLSGTAAIAMAFAATPAVAQYGGSPAEQVEGAPNETQSAPNEAEPAPEGVNRYVDVPSYGNAEEAEIAGKDQAGEGYASVDLDVDGDVDADVDADVDGDGDGQGENLSAPSHDNSDDPEGEAVEDQGPEPEGATWRGEDGRAYCRRSDGTTGLVVGGGAGALVGRGIDGGRNRAAGTIIGALIGAVVGSAVDRSAAEQSCR